ncbi:NmrA family transcriptional regulator [Flavobacterium rivuli WB 3.3-2 = DSM 21788]|uniref:NmrA family transcriptional regulator n=1 Tax=Flavobacterium rivuli WB 3.3-2 = DSM 21788 TaxID=1121895 RepID=A0A0A2M7R9_9FLAO|nr:SDR family oxidoreductase [Flavobacterium rivuli]KGO88672.1 NmrA family transcriptional regulator [Flavobacterium rivuli WB 3.3-2 = DSM 21788]
MKILVIGGSGLIGTKTVNNLRQLGHDVTSASPQTGINTITGEGLAEAVNGSDVVIDLANSPSFADADVMEFFETSGKNLLAAEINAGVKHHIALSVVGTDRLQQSGYFRAKQVQEDLIKKSGVPYTIIHSTQFMEFLGGIVASAHAAGSVTLSPAKIQPIAAEDVAAIVTEVALANPINKTVEIGGPERFSLSGLVKNYLTKTNDPLTVVEDEKALYFGAPLEDLTLVPNDGAKLGSLTFEEWFPNRPQPRT